MKPSLTLLPLLLAIVVLSGCPDPKLPKAPPKVPEPKALTYWADSPPSPGNPLMVPCGGTT
jgi:hypothetical protein